MANNLAQSAFKLLTPRALRLPCCRVSDVGGGRQLRSLSAWSHAMSTHGFGGVQSTSFGQSNMLQLHQRSFSSNIVSVKNRSILFGKPSFKVIRIQYEKNKIELLNMDTPELLKSSSIFARDLLTLGVTSRQERLAPRFAQKAASAIVPRDNLILINLGYLRAVVGLNEVYLLDAHRLQVQDFASEIVQVFQRKHEHEKTSPEATMSTHEMVFLEGVLRATVNSYSRRVHLYEPIIRSFLDKVDRDVYSSTGIHLLAPLKDSLKSFEIAVQQSTDCLESILDNDDAMLDLLLTEQKAAHDSGTEVDFTKHEQVEILLGVYARQLANVLSEIKYMLGRLQSKQEFVQLAMAHYRNRYIRMNLNISIAGLSLAVGTTVAGFFGMNLVSGIEEHAFAFYYVVMSTTLSGMVVAFTSLNYISGSSMRVRAEERLEEIETLGSALSDMCALDYTIKHASKERHSLGKDEFRQLLKSSRRSREVREEEVDLLFGMFDRIRDGEINTEDLPFLDYVEAETSPPRDIIPTGK